MLCIVNEENNQIYVSFPFLKMTNTVPSLTSLLRNGSLTVHKSQTERWMLICWNSQRQYILYGKTMTNKFQHSQQTQTSLRFSCALTDNCSFSAFRLTLSFAIEGIPLITETCGLRGLFSLYFSSEIPSFFVQISLHYFSSAVILVKEADFLWDEANLIFHCNPFA